MVMYFVTIKQLLNSPHRRQREARLGAPRHGERVAAIQRGACCARRDLGDEGIAAGHAQPQLAMVAEIDHFLELRAEPVGTLRGAADVNALGPDRQYNKRIQRQITRIRRDDLGAVGQADAAQFAVAAHEPAVRAGCSRR